MQSRFYEPPRPAVPRAQIPSRILSVVGGGLTAVMFVVVTGLVGPQLKPGTVLTVLIYAVYVADLRLIQRADSFADELYEFLKDVGQSVIDGSGVEHALSLVSRRRGGPVAKVFNAALRRAENKPIEIALLDEAANLGNEAFEEAAKLLSLVAQSEGPVGAAIRDLGQRLGEVRSAERKAHRISGNGLMTMTFFVVVLFPAAGAYIAKTIEIPLSDWSLRFYGLLALGIGALQFAVYRSLRRALARQPAYMLTVYWILTLIHPIEAVTRL